MEKENGNCYLGFKGIQGYIALLEDRDTGKESASYYVGLRARV